MFKLEKKFQVTRQMESRIPATRRPSISAKTRETRSQSRVTSESDADDVADPVKTENSDSEMDS